MGKKTRESGKAQLDELRELVAGGDGDGASPKKTDRRGMLRMAGAAVLGAAGVAAVKVLPASASTGGFMILGCANTASTDTTLSNSGGTVGFSAVGANGLQGTGASGAPGEIGVVGISKSGGGTGVSGQATTGTGVKGSVTSGTGVYGLASSGTGVLGVAPTNGIGVEGSTGGSGLGVYGVGAGGRGGLFVSTTGYDVALGYPVGGGVVGSGRLGMVGRLDTGTVAPNIAPAFQVTSTGAYTFEHELVRGNDSSIWASRFSAGGTNQSRWKRINSVRTDTIDGLGNAFKPFRLIDTRSGAIKAAGDVTTLTVAGTGTGASSIPSDAIAVMGNLTAAAYTGGGFLTIMPAGIAIGTGVGQYNPSVDPSSVNFIVGQYAIANSFVCGLKNGQLEVYVGGPPLPGHSSHYIVDITAYLQ